MEELWLKQVVGAVKRASGWSIALGVLMIMLGIIAILAPWEFGILIVMVVGWVRYLQRGRATHLRIPYRTAAAAQFWKPFSGSSISWLAFTC